MKDHILYPLFCKFRPNEAQLEGQRALEPFIEFVLVLYLAPFALIGLIWLVAVSDWTALTNRIMPILILCVALYIIRRQPASIPIEIAPGSRITLISSMAGVAIWAGIFIVGPMFLWGYLGISTVDRLVFLRQRKRFQQEAFWQPLAYYLQDIAGTLLPCLIALAVYHAFGGRFPISGYALHEWLPAILIIILNTVLSSLLLLPILFQVNRLISPGENPLRSVLNILFSVGITSLATTPFAVLFSILFTNGGLGIYVWGLIGLVLVNTLAHYLSRMNLRSQQRTREMTHLEALGEEIIQAPPDGSTLVNLLRNHIAAMFYDDQDILEIRIFEGETLTGFAGDVESLNLIHPPHNSPIPDSLWDDLQKTDDSHLVIKDTIIPGMKAVYGDAIIDKITSAAPTENGEVPACIGGVYLLRHKTVARTIHSLPAVQALASQVASALYRAQVHAETLNAHKMAQELEFAGNIQASFLPEKVPAVDGWGIAASLTPARQTAGDFYDFIPLGDDKLGIVVADVADKGTGAALYMALSRTLIRTHAMQFPNNPAEALRLANERILADTRANQFVTVFYGVLDLISGEMIYCNAGHNPAFAIRAANPDTPESYIRTGPPLGIFGELEWQEDTAQINLDDILLLYTDGVNEAQNTAEDFYAYERLLAVTKSNLSQSAETLHAEIIDSLQSFVGDAPQFDDITLMVLKRNPLEKDL
jgi:serine phosphatase RsbU (regulator of sigma subunit)